MSAKGQYRTFKAPSHESGRCALSSLTRPLSKLHDLGFCIGAFRAFKNPLIVTVLVRWLHVRKQHRQSAGRASALADWRWSQIETACLWQRQPPQRLVIFIGPAYSRTAGSARKFLIADACCCAAKNGRSRARLVIAIGGLLLVANTTRFDDHSTARRLNALADHAASTRVSVRVTTPVSMVIPIVPIGAGTHADANRTNLHADALRVHWCHCCRTRNRECRRCDENLFHNRLLLLRQRPTPADCERSVYYGVLRFLELLPA